MSQRPSTQRARTRAGLSLPFVAGLAGLSVGVAVLTVQLHPPVTPNKAGLPVIPALPAPRLAKPRSSPPALPPANAPQGGSNLLAPSPSPPVNQAAVTPAPISAAAPLRNVGNGPPATPPVVATLQEDVHFVVETHAPQVKACYDRAFRASSAPPAGRVELRFTLVDRDGVGRAQDVETGLNLLGSPQVAACLAELLTEWRFPRPLAPQQVQYPFLFAPTQPE